MTNYENPNLNILWEQSKSALKRITCFWKTTRNLKWCWIWVKNNFENVITHPAAGLQGDLAPKTGLLKGHVIIYLWDWDHSSQQLSKVIWFTRNTQLIKCTMNALFVNSVLFPKLKALNLFKLKYIYKSGNFLYKHVYVFYTKEKGLKLWHNLQQKLKTPCYAW